jgi:carboxyl-terminal processing protease
MPDVFVAADTSNYSEYYRDLIRKGVFNSFILEYTDKNRAKLKSAYTKFDDFRSKFEFTPEEVNSFIKAGEDAGVKFNEKDFAISKSEVLRNLKALIAGDIWQTSEFYRIYNEGDVVIEKALKIIGDNKSYNKILGY